MCRNFISQKIPIKILGQRPALLAVLHLPQPSAGSPELYAGDFAVAEQVLLRACLAVPAQRGKRPHDTGCVAGLRAGEPTGRNGRAEAVEATVELYQELLD